MGVPIPFESDSAIELKPVAPASETSIVSRLNVTSGFEGGSLQELCCTPVIHRRVMSVGRSNKTVI